MSTSLPLFDRVFSGKPDPQGKPLTGEELRDSGTKSVLEHTPEEYKRRFMEIIKGFPRDTAFTSEDVRQLAGDPPEGVHYNCFGALIRSAAQANLIIDTGRGCNAKRASLHASRLTIWMRL